MAKIDTFQDLAITAAEDGQELWRWLYSEIRTAIMEARLRPGSRLPSTRSLAAQYQVSRGTVVTAFSQLQSEGYIEGRISSGTFVATKLFMEAHDNNSKGAQLRGARAGAKLATHTKKTLHSISVLPGTHQVGKAFRAYEPALDLFPVELWARTASRVLRNAPRWLYGQGSAGGYQPLKRAISEYLGPARGVRCAPEQIIITSGAQQALDLLARLLLDPEDEVWMEDPGYTGALHAFRAAGASIVPVPIDAEGIDVRAGRQLAPQAKLAYVTPANQFPLGVSMSADRRVDLLRWARDAGAWLIEDDYDAEYRYSGRPLASLQALDKSGTVIYVGTFTKMLFNALRIGFMVLPAHLVSAFEAGRSFVDRHPPTLDQAILAEFITEGHFGHHVRKMRQVYAQRKSILTEVCARYAGDLLTISPTETGIRTIAWLPSVHSDVEVANRAQSLGLEVMALSSFSIRKNVAPGLILGFAGCDARELRRGAAVLAEAVADSPQLGQWTHKPACTV
jgi:GntR family transcriptional regulator/MocR family aminotransferase